MSAEGQFSHPLVVRAKLEIAAACHGRGKVPSHCVVTEFTDMRALAAAATRAARELGYLRMWSIHPNQIRTIVEAFAPSAAEVDQAIEIIDAAQAADWAPTRHRDRLHDRASYRYFWQVLDRAAAHRPAAAGRGAPALVRLPAAGVTMPAARLPQCSAVPPLRSPAAAAGYGRPASRSSPPFPLPFAPS